MGTQTDVIRSKHFKESDFYYPGVRKMLKKEAIPCVKRSKSASVSLWEDASELNIRLKKRVEDQKKKLRNMRKRECVFEERLELCCQSWKS